MSDPVFDAAIDWILGIETGQITNDQRDPGGLTHWGISQRAYPDLNIRSLTKDQAIGLYRSDYWTPSYAQFIADHAPRLGVALFDAAVNQGSGTAIKLFQQSMGLKSDGIFGPDTRAAAMRTNDGLLPEFLGYRAVRYAESRNHTFMRGWMNRLFLLQEFLYRRFPQ